MYCILRDFLLNHTLNSDKFCSQFYRLKATIDGKRRKLVNRNGFLFSWISNINYLLNIFLFTMIFFFLNSFKQILLLLFYLFSFLTKTYMKLQQISRYQRKNLKLTVWSKVKMFFSALTRFSYLSDFSYFCRFQCVAC